MNKIDFLILGGGIAGTTAAEEIRSKDQNSSITIITEEPQRLYSRVLLPHFLRNENSLDSLFMRPEDNYQKKNIQLLTNLKVTKVDTQSKAVTTSDNQTFEYGKLLVATGGKVNKLSTTGSNLPEVVYLRTFEDAKKIRELINNSKEAVVLGGGFIGIEFAQSFIKNGLKTTAIVMEKAFWEVVVGENSGELLTQILSENGVDVLTETQVTEFSGQDKLESVKTDKGTEIKADIAGVGIGIYLDIDYLKDSGLTLKKGIVTNEFLETSVPDVWAAGDAAEFYDPVFKKYHTLGNWANASSQGRTAGLNMVGEKTAFETTSLYSISVFGSNFSFLGDPTVDDQTEVIERGSVADKKLARLLIRDDQLIGASLINLPVERGSITRLIKDKVKITSTKAKLSDLSFDLSTIS